MYQYGNLLTAVVWEGVIHKGIVLEELRYMEGDVFLDREYLPDGAVIVVKKGTRLHEICGVEGELDLGWVKLIGAENPCQGLPEYKGSDLEGTLWLKKYRDTVLVVSEELWEEHLEEVERLLFPRGMAWSDTWTFQCHEASEYEITLGGDPEFEVVVDGEVVPAYLFPIFGGLNAPIGTDGSVAEIRPYPTVSPERYVKDFLSLAEKVGKEGILLSVKGDVLPLGGHIHVGSHNRYIVDVLKDKAEEFIFVLDDFLGRVLLPTSGKARGECARLGHYELKEYGWEYKSLPSSFYADPEMVRIVYKLVKGLVLALLRNGTFSYRILDDGRAAMEEYYRFLTPQETEYFLSFPQRWARGEIHPFVPVKAAI
jgi:hypothetical protein